jgi:CheY-like chemotaxis protein
VRADHRHRDPRRSLCGNTAVRHTWARGQRGGVRREIDGELNHDPGMALPDPPYAVVIDDDPITRELLGDALYRYGLVPLLVSSGAEAIGLQAGASAPVLVVLPSRVLDMPPARILARLRTDARWARARVLLTLPGPASGVPDGMHVDGVLRGPFEAASFRAVMADEPGGGR